VSESKRSAAAATTSLASSTDRISVSVAPDSEVIAVATREDRVLLTGDRSDFADPPIDNHTSVRERQVWRERTWIPQFCRGVR
jgi:hypothetical protein